MHMLISLTYLLTAKNDSDNLPSYHPDNHYSSGVSLVKERSCRNALDHSCHLQERSRLFSNSFALRMLS